MKEPNFFNVPEPLATFLKNALDRLKKDEHLVGVTAGGSHVTRSMDESSDLDLLIAVEPAAYGSVLNERQLIARVQQDVLCYAVVLQSGASHAG